MSQPKRVAVLAIVAALALMLGGVALVYGEPAAPTLETVAGVPVSGRVFYDLDMDGVADPDEPGVDGAQVELSGSGQPPFVTSDADGGAFAFPNVEPGVYTAIETDGLNKHSTTLNPVSVTVGGDPVTVNFGLVLKIDVSGRVYQDVDGNGAYNAYTPGGDPADELLVGATVMIIDDRNGNGRMDAGEPIIGSALSDGVGNFVVPNIVPGARIMAVQPAELGGIWGEPAPLSLPASAMGGVTVGDVAVAGAVVQLEGTVWNDVDGDEIVEAGEPGLAGVKLEVYGAVSGQEPGASPLIWAVTDSAGRYLVGGLFAGWSYEVRPVASTLPAGWIMSQDPALLFVTPTAAGPNIVNIGYYDPLSVAPLRQSDWKKELKQAGKPRYSPEQIYGANGFIATAELQSGVYAEVAGISEVLLHSPVQGDLGQALREYAALRLNLASSRLYEATAVNLPELTQAKSIGGVVAEIEGILAPGRTPAPTKDELQRVRRLAEAINSGMGLGAGRTGVFALASGTYRGVSVVSKLRPGGDLVEVGTDAPAYLLKWSPGTLNSNTNVLNPQLRVKVKVFMDGGVLDAVQVLPDGRTALLGTIVPPVWNKDVNATYLFNLQGVSTAEELISSQIRLVVRDPGMSGKAGRVRIDSTELVFKY